jgi:DNA polymerase III psi subunit
MHSTQRQYYLATMGIQVWQLRDQPIIESNVKVAYLSYALLNQQGQKIGKVFIEERYAESSLQEKISRLLAAMLASIGLQLLRSDNIASLEIQDKTIIMGQALAQYLLNTTLSLDELRQKTTHAEKSIITTYHPLDLLVQPLYKRNAWQDLQKLLA